jgi:hypothetical protein
MGWPQQPPTEKVLKFNMTFHDSTKKKKFFQNIKIKLNSWIWSSDISVLGTSAASKTSTASTTSNKLHT